MKRTLIAFTFAAVTAALISSCASGRNKTQDLMDEYYMTVRDDIKSFNTDQPDEIDKRFVIEIEKNAAAPEVADIAASDELEPDYIYTTVNVTKRLALLEIKEEINELGLKHVLVYLQSSKASPFRWAFSGDKQDAYDYEFIWFDANGKKIDTGVVPHRYQAHPGSVMRIVGYAPTEECKSFSMILVPAKEEEAVEESNDTIVTSIEEEQPATIAETAKKEEPSDNGKKTAEDTKKLIEANK